MASYHCPVRGRIHEVSPIEAIDPQTLHGIACLVMDVVAQRAANRPIPEGVKEWEWEAEAEKLGCQAFKDFQDAATKKRIWEGPTF